MKFIQLSIKNKFILVSISLMLILAFFSIFIISMNARLADVTSKIFTHPLEVSNAASYANVEVLRMHRDLKDVLIKEEDYEINLLVDKIRVSESNVYIALDTIGYYILGDEGERLHEEARELFDESRDIRSDVIGYIRADQYEEAVELAKNKGADHLQRFEQKLSELNQYARKKAESFQNESLVLENQIRILTVAGTLAVFLIIITLILWLSFNVLGGIRVLGDSMQDIMSSGEFKDLELEGDDELVSLSRVFNQLIGSLGRQLWVREGIEKSNDILTDVNISGNRLKNFLENIVVYNNYLSAAYYELKTDDLELMTSVNRLGFMDNHYVLGEHIVGECAFDKTEKSIVYSKNEQMDTNESFPFHTVLVKPIIYDDVLYGVVEIVLLKQSTIEESTVLDEALFSLGTYMASTNQRDRIDKLFEESIKANEQLMNRHAQLEEQTEELEAANDTLQNQKDLLNMKTHELGEQNKELEDLREELLAKYKDLEELSVYRSQFLTNISHELKTPLNSIILLSSVLSGKDDIAFTLEDKNQIDVINKAGNELLIIINDILDLSKVESGKIILEEDVFESNDIVDEIKMIYASTINSKDIKCRFEDKLNSSLYGDKSKILHIVTNFLSNAVKFTKEGYISIIISRNEDVTYPISINITDTGIGIREDKLQVIFEEFVQSDGSISRTYGGTGLGLSICKNYAYILGATIDVKSTFGMGSTFSLLLPARNLLSEHEKQEQQTYFASMRKPAVFVKEILSEDKRHKKVLICDDEPMNVFALSAMLEDIGVIPVTALSGVEAIELYKIEDEIDLIFIDYMMPDMDGIETIKQFKALPEFVELPIVMVTAATLDKQELAFIDEEASAYIQKPIIYNTIVKTLETLL